jgi:hypothetical protein
MKVALLDLEVAKELDTVLSEAQLKLHKPQLISTENEIVSLVKQFMTEDSTLDEPHARQKVYETRQDLYERHIREISEMK